MAKRGKNKQQSLAPTVLRIPVSGLTVGLRKNIPQYMVPPNGLIDCHNVWIQNKSLEVVDGWALFEGRTDPVPDCRGPITLIDELNLLSGTNIPIVGTPTDVYRRSGYGEWDFITPNYTTGTVTVTNGSPTVTGSETGWSSSNVTVSDRIRIGSDTKWYSISEINYDTQTITLTENYTGSSGSGKSYEVRLLYEEISGNRWSSEVFKDVFLFVGPSTPLQYWDGNSGNRVQTAAGYTAKHIFNFKERPILIGVSEEGASYPQRIRWANAGTYDDWTVQVGSEAGYLDFIERPDWVVCGHPLGDYGVIYKERSIHLISYIGPPFVFQRREVISGIGAIGPFAVGNLGNDHIFMGPDNFYIFNGVDIYRIGDTIWQEVFTHLDPSKQSEVIAFHREEKGVIEFIIPTVTGEKICYIYHYVESDPEKELNVWTKRDLPATSVGYFTQSEDYVWDQMGDLTWEDADFTWDSRNILSLAPLNVFGDKNGVLWTIGHVNSFGGEPIQAYAVMGPVGWSHPQVSIEDRTKELILVEPWVDMSSQGMVLQIVVGNSMRGGGPFSYDYSGNYYLDGSGYPWVNFQCKGRIFSIKFSTPSSGQIGNRWRLYGYLVELGIEGRT